MLVPAILSQVLRITCPDLRSSADWCQWGPTVWRRRKCSAAAADRSQGSAAAAVVVAAAAAAGCRRRPSSRSSSSAFSARRSPSCYCCCCCSKSTLGVFKLPDDRSSPYRCFCCGIRSLLCDTEREKSLMCFVRNITRTSVTSIVCCCCYKDRKFAKLLNCLGTFGKYSAKNYLRLTLKYYFFGKMPAKYDAAHRCQNS